MGIKKVYCTGVGKKIKELRLERGLTQEELAIKCGYTSRSTINKIELGINDITQSKLINIANALGVDAVDLIDINDETGKENFKTTFSKQLRKYMEIYNKTQADLANDLGFDKSTVSTWVNGTRTPRMDKVDILAKYFHCLRSDLVEDVDRAPDPTYTVTINVLGQVAAGKPISAIENVIDTMEIPHALVGKGTFFGLKIKGDSMEPYILDGDTVIVRQCQDCDDGDIVIALVNGDDGVCKKLRRSNGRICLISLNTKYDPMVFDKREIDSVPVRIIGQVVEVRRTVTHI